MCNPYFLRDTLRTSENALEFHERCGGGVEEMNPLPGNSPNEGESWEKDMTLTSQNTPHNEGGGGR